MDEWAILRRRGDIVYFTVLDDSLGMVPAPQRLSETWSRDVTFIWEDSREE